MRATCINMIHELAKLDKRVIFVGSDLRPGLLSAMQKEFPSRYFMEGVSEQYIIGMVTGLALDGFMPFVNTIGTFLTRRCLDQIVVGLCVHDLPVRLIGSGGGFVYAPLGPTHQAIDDLALMRAIPNMTVVAPADAVEMRELMLATMGWPGPIYIRLAKGGDEIISASRPFRFGKGVPLSTMMEDVSTARTVLFASTGAMSARAKHTADLIWRERQIPCEVLHFPTLKPFDAPLLAEYAKRAKLVVTVEDHSIIGGLGSAVTDALIKLQSGSLSRIINIGIPDVFTEEYGTQDDLLSYHHLQPEQIAETVCGALEIL